MPEPELTDEQIAANEAAAEAPTRDRKPKARPKRRKPEPSGAEKARKRRERQAGHAAAANEPAAPPATPAQVKALERGLAKTLTAPALPALLLPLPIDTKLFMLTHFTQAGPATAKQLAEAAEQSPELRELLERANKGSATLTLLVAGCIYLAPVVLWVTGQREAAAVTSSLASMDPAELEANAQAMQEQMAAQMQEAMMAAANGNGTEQPGAESPEHQGPTDPQAQAEPPQAS